MKRLLLTIFSSPILFACTAHNPGPAIVDESQTVQTQALSKEEKAKLKKEREILLQTHKAKCQDAKLDLVQAEGNEDRNAINVANNRIRQYCTQ